MRRQRDALEVLEVRSACDLPRDLDVLGVGPLRVGCGVEPYQLVVGQAGCGVFGGARGCARLWCVLRCLLLGRASGELGPSRGGFFTLTMSVY